MDKGGTSLQLRVNQASDVAHDIREFELVRPDGGELPAFTAGAHLNIDTPSGQSRKYSLCNSPLERNRYVIAVKHERSGKGGSASMHRDVQVGTLLTCSPPENAFELVDNKRGYLFIAGGIGITPIYAMVQYLAATGELPWQLIYLSRSPEGCAYLERLNTDPRVTIHHDMGDPRNALDLWPLLEQPRGRQLYCCGPNGLMDAVRDMSGHWPTPAVHFESFVQGGEKKLGDRPFAVRLARTGIEFQVPVGKSILDCMREVGGDQVSSCESGTCGTCKTALIDGEADHRDMVLMPEERAGYVMVCVSRAKGERLTLDL
ncbi:MAG TPA: PDR/VanB family oxidoreductase [Rubrivivax sp.]|nr:PDR/VanB family oxidoreductase [Rubrivivax sp.]